MSTRLEAFIHSTNIYGAPTLSQTLCTFDAHILNPQTKWTWMRVLTSSVNYCKQGQSQWTWVWANSGVGAGQGRLCAAVHGVTKGRARLSNWATAISSVTHITHSFRARPKVFTLWGFFFWSPVCRSIETPVRWPRCFFKLQNFPAEFHNGSMLAVYCWNISRENSFGRGGKYILKKITSTWSSKSHRRKLFTNTYLFIHFPSVPESSRYWDVKAKKGHL